MKNHLKKQMHTWHWISSAVCLICMMLFAITGITLNHAEYFDASPEVTEHEGELPPELLNALNTRKPQPRLPEDIINWIKSQWSVDTELLLSDAEWNAYEIYVQKTIPGGDQWLSVDLETGQVSHMHTDRGWISWLNDLHKGRNTHTVWIWFLDVFSVATLIFCITGLVLLQIHSKRRPMTWYFTFAGVLVPGLLIAVFF
ncbi:PepSY-associated TM helix domain-containing protein [Marinicella sediminis]|uniref:PepSY-associated TM helix domain-containing protein n=1 Tax=Marinicella sediminis TaxID=1792834 RepID=A0ABV7JHZ4_9GAMM|nr:PepSY-associated TM helix domain-containing protein [Marinicella sediminis]